MKQLVEFLINSKSTGIIQDNDFVDLGLSVLLAKCNIGAKEETDYGHYYQWGGLESMDNKECNWENTPFNNGKNKFDEDYFNSIKDKVAPNGILDKKYDIAYQTYKGKVHIPTKDNFDELISGTNNKWINNYNDSGINGRLFTGKNGNSIFIPATGYRWDYSTIDTGSFANVWSASISTDYEDNAWDLDFYSDDIGTNINHRYFGFSVRAVKEK